MFSSAYDYVTDQVHDYFHPPDKLRESRTRLRRESARMTRQMHEAEEQYDRCVAMLQSKAHAMSDAELREAAREAATKKQTAASFALALRQLSIAEARLATAGATNAVRDSIRVTATALGVANAGGPGALAMDVTEMMREQHMSDQLRTAVHEAVAEDEGDNDTETLVQQIFDNARGGASGSAEALPSVPMMRPAAEESRELEELVSRLAALKDSVP